MRSPTNAASRSTGLTGTPLSGPTARKSSKKNRHGKVLRKRARESAVRGEGASVAMYSGRLRGARGEVGA